MGERKVTKAQMEVLRRMVNGDGLATMLPTGTENWPEPVRWTFGDVWVSKRVVHGLRDKQLLLIDHPCCKITPAGRALVEAERGRK